MLKRQRLLCGNFLAFKKKYAMKRITVIAAFEIEGFHHYPEAPKEVSFLSASHRHTFKVTCQYAVTGMNREKEIFMLRDELESYLGEAYGIPCQFGAMSCEMIADELLEFGKEDGMICCEVWEEATGGARVEL